jgi:BirA family biotin operon repressor/biotin-[acetyl-CoA-carboxylase] ligase
MAALARQGAPEGLWLRAERQTGGKGRQGRAWFSPAGNLHASTLVRLRPGDPPAPTLAFVAAVALHEVAAAHASAARIEIKWPNDLVAGGAKLAGVLLEREGEAVTIGFGVNLAAQPAELERPAISMAALTGAAPDVGSFLEELAAGFERWLDTWRGGGFALVRDAWLQAAHPRGTALSVRTGSGVRLEGAFEGLDTDGALRLRLADGGVHIVHAGDVFLA